MILMHRYSSSEFLPILIIAYIKRKMICLTIQRLQQRCIGTVKQENALQQLLETLRFCKWCSNVDWNLGE